MHVYGHGSLGSLLENDCIRRDVRPHLTYARGIAVSTSECGLVARRALTAYGGGTTRSPGARTLPAYFGGASSIWLTPAFAFSKAENEIPSLRATASFSTTFFSTTFTIAIEAGLAPRRT